MAALEVVAEEADRLDASLSGAGDYALPYSPLIRIVDTADEDAEPRASISGAHELILSLYRSARKARDDVLLR